MMNEKEYIQSTNLQKFRIIAELLNDCLPSVGLSEVQQSSMLIESRKIRDDLFESINLAERDV